jgi:hypothetical protein
LGFPIVWNDIVRNDKEVCLSQWYAKDPDVALKWLTLVNVVRTYMYMTRRGTFGIPHGFHPEKANIPWETATDVIWQWTVKDALVKQLDKVESWGTSDVLCDVAKSPPGSDTLQHFSRLLEMADRLIHVVLSPPSRFRVDQKLMGASLNHLEPTPEDVKVFTDSENRAKTVLLQLLNQNAQLDHVTSEPDPIIHVPEPKKPHQSQQYQKSEKSQEPKPVPEIETDPKPKKPLTLTPKEPEPPQPPEEADVMIDDFVAINEKDIPKHTKTLGWFRKLFT